MKQVMKKVSFVDICDLWFLIKIDLRDKKLQIKCIMLDRSLNKSHHKMI